MKGYTIKSAQWSSDPSAVVIQTVESGAVIVSERDRPQLWEHLMASGVEIMPAANPAPKPTENKGPGSNG